MQEPRQRDRGRFLAELRAELLPPFELRADAFVARLHRLPSRDVATREIAPEHPARERAPRNHAEPVEPARLEHLELDRARREVVQTLLADESEKVPRFRRFVRLRDVPAGEVA